MNLSLLAIEITADYTDGLWIMTCVASVTGRMGSVTGRMKLELGLGPRGNDIMNRDS